MSWSGPALDAGFLRRLEAAVSSTPSTALRVEVRGDLALLSRVADRYGRSPTDFLVVAGVRVGLKLDSLLPADVVGVRGVFSYLRAEYSPLVAVADLPGLPDVLHDTALRFLLDGVDRPRALDLARGVLA